MCESAVTSQQGAEAQDDSMTGISGLIASFYLVDRGLWHRPLGISMSHSSF
jgi:hypothetical protein